MHEFFARRARRLASLAFKQRRCPFCGWFGYRFEPYGNAKVRRDDAQCPICGSLERHRAAYLLLRDKIAPGQKVLHVAPETLVIPWLVSLSSEYRKTLVWCSHVLEHIPDDCKALSEMYRILAPGGLLVLQVPIRGDKTFEDPRVTTDAERLQKFLQEDHVRLYGRDLKERTEDVGFVCEMLTAADLPVAEQTLYAIKAPLYREIFFCRKSI